MEMTATVASSPSVETKGWNRLAADDLTRKLLWPLQREKKAVFAVQVPARADQIRDSAYVGHEYVSVGGVRVDSHGAGGSGFVNRFIHYERGSVRKLLGKTIVCTVELREKDCGDGRKFIYIDYLVEKRASSVTHELRIAGARRTVEKRSEGLIDVVVFPTPAPLQGAVIIGRIPKE